MYVLVNERVSRIDDGLRGTVVTLQLEQLRIRILLAEIENITDIRTAERIDTLRVVTYHTYIVLRCRQTVYQQELDIVRVLVLVHQEILKMLLPFIAHIRESVHDA